MENEFALVEDTDLKIATKNFTKLQRDFLCFKAMGSKDGDARHQAGVAESTLREWKKDELFLNTYSLVGMGAHKTEGIEVWLDNQLPVVFSELMNIIGSGSDGNRAHKDKERAIEFFLKELCGISKHTEKSVSLAKLLVEYKE